MRISTTEMFQKSEPLNVLTQPKVSLKSVFFLDISLILIGHWN